MTCGSVLTDAVANLAAAAKGSYNEKKPSVVTFRGQLPAILYPENGGRMARLQLNAYELAVVVRSLMLNDGLYAFFQSLAPECEQ